MPSIRSAVLAEERMRPGHWLGLVLFVLFRALALMVGFHEGYPVHERLVTLITRDSVLEWVEESVREGTS